MDDNEVDRYRLRELHVWDPGYKPLPWESLPEEARNSWRNSYENRFIGGQQK